ncbi:helix-turn-helix domain-containing protein [Herbidospora cretacea]|uniref:helix-turn-helix domain-containing protein n=1 Tax=Herbidospora cretacea TaxID=28444 RepID=UPI0004C3688A|nr:helix-turn-helix domain-containing protein [Herbidospora cretacea]
MATLAERLTEALRAKKVSNREAARALKKAGTPISHVYIGLLCSGGKANPTLEQMEALARFLGVSVGWLAGEEAPTAKVAPSATSSEEQERRQVLSDLNALGVLNVAERMTGLSPLSIEAIRTMVEAMRTAERVDEQDT